MRELLRPLGVGLLLSLAASCAPRSDGARTLEEVLQTANPDDWIPILVHVAEPSGSATAGLAAAPELDPRRRRAALVSELQTRAASSQVSVRELLQRSGASQVQSLWIVDAVAARVHPALVRVLLQTPGVRSVVLDARLRAPVSAVGSGSVPEWNLGAIHAPALWSLGFDGTDVVVANMDTGVDLQHADLQPRWRGGADSWWDPYRNTSTPYDIAGHGTATMGLLVGGSAGGSAIGVAPGARWIAAKIYDDQGETRVSVIHQAFQWLLSPSGVPGAADAPQVVNASWGIASAGTCDLTFEPDLQALRAAGIVVAFAAGNSGPGPGTSVSPANNPDGYSTGSIDSLSVVAPDSSRGPSPCPGSGVFPDVVAPGVNVRTAAISLGGVPHYTTLSGTSMAVPHLAGAVALLAGAFPGASVETLEEILRDTAHDLGPVGPDDDDGYGIIDAEAAYRALGSATPLTIATSSLPEAFAGVSYSQALRAVGSIAPYTWTLTGGSLPPELALSRSGVLSGTPTSPGDSSFTVTVQSVTGTTASQALALSVVEPSLMVTTTTLPPATLANPYAQTLSAVGGTPPYRWSVAAIGCSNALPPGIGLEQATGALSGTPLTRGTYDFIIAVTDARFAVATRTLSLAVQ